MLAEPLRQKTTQQTPLGFQDEDLNLCNISSNKKSIPNGMPFSFN